MSCPVSHHGVSKARGCSHAQLGRFGRLFDLEPNFVSDETLEALGASGGLMHETPNSKTPGNKSGDSRIPAAYTFFAQFVDHDITLDVTSRLNSTQVQDAEELPNLRSPTLDLDCVYGFGPEASPFLYDGNGRLLTGNAENKLDLTRVITGETSGDIEIGRALIGDPRNDENIFVSQLQLAFHLFHNRLMDELKDFEEAQRQARFHYQYIVLHDFLARVCDPNVYRIALERIYRREAPLFYRLDDSGHLPMPVEFSVAAYRFGHSLVRSKYKPNASEKPIELFDKRFGTLGFSVVPAELTVEWRFLFDQGATSNSKKVDELLTNELIDLPTDVVEDSNPLNRSLAFRNLVRGRSLGLPSGQAVADLLSKSEYGIEPVDLKLETIPGWKKLSVSVKKELKEKTPLFFYLLRESNVLNKGSHLGPTASAILLEVFGGILSLCSSSFLGANWSPTEKIVGPDHILTLADVLRYVERY